MWEKKTIYFMNINNEFMMMRAPVTNRQFLNFLNTNQQLNVDIVNIKSLVLIQNRFRIIHHNRS